MLKRVISLFLCSALVFSIACFSAFADESNNYDTCTHEWEQPIDHWYGIPIPGTDITFGVDVERCSKCGLYKHTADLLVLKSTYYSPLPPHLNGIVPSELITYWLNVWYNFCGKNATPTKVPSGIGRKDLPGYADDKGSALVDKDGWPTATYTMLLDGYDTSAGVDTVYKHSASNNGSWYSYVNGSFSGSNGNVSVYGTYGDENNGCVDASVSYYFVAPVSGYYIFSSPPIKYTSFTKSSNGFYQYSFNASGIEVRYWFGVGVSSSNWFDSNFTPTESTSSITKNYSSYTIYAKKGEVLFARFSAATVYGVGPSYPYKYISIHTSAPTLTVQDLSPSQITNNNNITINNNTWNGNIYTDNSTNLTYIYPQSTTINEKNETVTNISNTPIIYNNETKQYYTYDQTTKNYYYITYNAQPTPSPSPSPAPSESPTPAPTPDPGTTPTTTPKPGGSISTPETGKPGGSSGSGQSWWDKLLDKIGNAVIDGLLGAVSAVLKLIFKLLSTILSWIIWAVSRVFDLLPFLPPGLGGLLVGGVVVCFVIGIIKFIRG